MIHNEVVASFKLMNLQSALAACGIETELFVDNVGGERILRLTGSLWNCADGSDVPFEVYAEESDSFESISHYVQPEDSVKKVFDNAYRAIAEAGEIAKEL